MTRHVDTAPVSYDPADLVALARERCGPPDAPLWFLDGLSVVAAALDTEARLSESGRRAMRDTLVGSLVTQTKLARQVARHPEIEQAPFPRVVFILGLLRTGTTLVHNLLAEHPDLRAPALWELMFPVDSGEEPDVLADRAQSYVEEYYRLSPTLPMIHFLDARRPDECHRLTQNAFHSMVYEMRFRVPSYSRWLAEQDMTEAYRYHRAQLAQILWRRPAPAVVLKCPFHTWNLAALARAYPGAYFVHMHRDPVSVVVSTCSLCESVRGARSDSVDRAEIGAQWLDNIDRGARLASADRRGALAGRPVLDVRYGDLTADTLGTLGRICDFIGVPLTGAAEQRMTQYLTGNPQHKRGVHQYTPEQYGLTPESIRTRLADYRDEFGV